MEEMVRQDLLKGAFAHEVLLQQEQHKTEFDTTNKLPSGGREAATFRPAA